MSDAIITERFKVCKTLKNLATIWFEYAGDCKDYLKVYQHRVSCPICQNNMKLLDKLRLITKKVAEQEK